MSPMQQKIVYLINPVSGTGKKDGLEKLIQQKTKARSIDFEILQTNAAGDYDYLKDKIAKDAITDVVMVGGDGTVNRVVASLYETGVNFGIIPMGSGNGLAFGAGIPKNFAKALDVVFKGNIGYVDAFTINDHFSCMLSGLGFDAQVAHDFANKASRGLLTYTQQSLVQYFKAHPYQFQIVNDNFSFFTDAFFISIANSNQFGNHFTIAPKANLDDGLLDIVIVQKMHKARLPFAILQQIRGNNNLQQFVEDMCQKNILYFQASSLTIRNLKLAPFHIDGEPAETNDEFKIDLIRRCFKLYMPVSKQDSKEKNQS
ncbi:MAG: transcription regulator containing diacylglycerol kinase catalytic domain [Segetibacter sp.]|jgi:diacylglycerol kinase (ATP)|nr:transcription regulator containing diacylglycerol kinase catalytic domain [Segetibacter sp.]